MESAILVGLITPEINKLRSEEYLDELAFLAKTAGATPIMRFTQKVSIPDQKTFLGKGKIFLRDLCLPYQMRPKNKVKVIKFMV